MEDWGPAARQDTSGQNRKSRAAIKSGWELVQALIRSAGTHAIGELAAGTAAGVGSDLAVQGLEQAAE
jgi:hypothetical protein